MQQDGDGPRSRLARAVVSYLTNAADQPYASLLEARHEDGRDILDIEVEVELAQDRKVAIMPKEPIRLVFPDADDARGPWVTSTRDDFPLGQVHTNLDPDADGLCLCLWEENWHDLSRTLTGQALVERIRWWLSAMAHGELHAEDQPLEPLIAATSDTIVFPPGDLSGRWIIDGMYKLGTRYTLVMAREHSAESAQTPFEIFSATLPSQVQGALADRPYEMAGLRDLTGKLGYDLLAELRSWMTAPERLSSASQRRILMLLAVPKRRSGESDDEAVEIWAYTLSDTLAELGEKLGFTHTYDDLGVAKTGAALSGAVAIELQEIILLGMRVVQRLDRASARLFSGSERRDDLRLVAIGAGAIGSNVVVNVTRAGLGTWTIIDDDVTLPHNTVRQFQSNWGVGRPKATTLAVEANSILADAGNDALTADLLRPADSEDRIGTAIEEADIVVDFSASPAVVGRVSDMKPKRAASFFFSPDGADLVILDEGRGRTVLLDEIEAQYFLAVAAVPALEGHLAAARTDRIRYANACQDLSRPLAPWKVQMLSGLAAGQLTNLVESEEPSASVWRLQPETGAVLPVRLAVQSTHRFTSDGIRATVSDGVIKAMRDFRSAASPNETGGVLIGTFDLVRNIVHVVAALPAPPDSAQAPTYFVRGAHDLRPIVEHLARATAGRLYYVGEWHSHPDGAAARPSGDDEQVFEHLRKHLEPVSSPFAMMICGAGETWARVGWQDRSRIEGVVAYSHG